MISKEKLVLALSNISKYTRQEIKSNLLYSSANYITFDQWTDHKNREFLSLTIRAYIKKKYSDYFLDLIQLTSEKNDARKLANEIINSLSMFNLSLNEISSCTTDNCNLMCATADELGLWKIQCVLHLLNKVFQVFVLAIKNKIQPIFDLISFLANSSKYTIFSQQKKFNEGIPVKKVPNYTEVQWTSFAVCIMTLYDTIDSVRDFIGTIDS